MGSTQVDETATASLKWEGDEELRELEVGCEKEESGRES